MKIAFLKPVCLKRFPRFRKQRLYFFIIDAAKKKAVLRQKRTKIPKRLNDMLNIAIAVKVVIVNIIDDRDGRLKC